MVEYRNILFIGTLKLKPICLGALLTSGGGIDSDGDSASAMKSHTDVNDI